MSEKETDAAALNPAIYLRLLDEAVDDFAFIAFDTQGFIRRWNQGAGEIFGYRRAEILGKPASTLFTPEDVQAGEHEKEIRTAASQGAAIDERWHLRKDGSRFWGSGTLHVLRGADGQPSAFIKVMRDRTRGRRVEEALLQSEQVFKLVLDNLRQHAVFLLDARGRIASWNEGAKRVFGYEEMEVLGQPFSLIFTPEDIALKKPEEELTASREQDFGLDERWHRRKDGSLFWASGAVYPLRNEEGELQGHVKVLQDRTEHKKNEEALLAWEARLHEARQLEAIGRLAGGVAHEFNNLLTSINGYAELLLSAPEISADTRDGLQEIRNSGGRAAELTQQLLSYSRKQILIPTVFDLNALVAGMTRHLQETLGDGVNFECTLDPAVGRVKVDRGQLESVLQNLARNSKEAMPEGGKAILRTFLEEVGTDPDAGSLVERNGGEGGTRKTAKEEVLKPGVYAVLSFEDGGRGMVPAILERIFEPFFSTKLNGSPSKGLGLSSAYGLMRQSGGTIRVTSEPGRGTAFRLYLSHLGPSEVRS